MKSQLEGVRGLVKHVPLHIVVGAMIAIAPSKGCWGGGGGGGGGGEANTTMRSRTTKADGGQASPDENKNNIPSEIDWENHEKVPSGVAEWDDWSPDGDPSLDNFFNIMKGAGVPSHEGGADDPAWAGTGSAGQHGSGLWGPGKDDTDSEDNPIAIQMFPWSKIKNMPKWAVGKYPFFTPGVDGAPGGGEGDHPNLKGIPNFQQAYGPGQNGSAPPEDAFVEMADNGQLALCTETWYDEDCGSSEDKTQAWRYNKDIDECESFTFCGNDTNAFSTKDLCEDSCLSSDETQCDLEHFVIDQDIYGRRFLQGIIRMFNQSANKSVD